MKIALPGNLTVEPNPIVFAGNDTTLCNGSTLQLQGEISGPGSETDCNYSLLVEDSFGDGWNGNTVTINVDGVSTDYTLDFLVPAKQQPLSCRVAPR